MGPGDTAHLRRAVERLKKRKIGPVLWPRYLDFVFKVFPKAAEGRCAFAPAAQAASAGWIEQFVATLGERPYSLEDADDVLIAGGFDLPGHKVISALDWAVKLKYGRTVPPRLEAENPEEWEQVKYLADHLDEVGFDDDPEGGND